MDTKLSGRAAIEERRDRARRIAAGVRRDAEELIQRARVLDAEAEAYTTALSEFPEAPKRGRPANGAAEKPAARKRGKRALGTNAAADTMDAAARAGLIPRTGAQEDRE